MSKLRSRVLVVDDEEGILRAVGRALVINGYDVETAVDGTTAIHSLAARAPDVVVLDVSMPGVDGLEVCRRLREAGDKTPVLMLTAREGVDDRVAGLDAGADDYLVKPFALEELLARLRALLRRAGPTEANEVLRYGDLSIDLGSREVRRAGREIELTRTEFLLLELLPAAPRSGSHAPSDLGKRLGLRLRPGLEFSRRLYRLPAQKDRVARRDSTDSNSPRRRIRPSGMSPPIGRPLESRGGWLGGGRAARLQVRSRVALIIALAVSVAVILVSASAYVVFRHDLLDSVDGTLTSQAETLNNARTHGGLGAALELLFSPPSLLANQPAEQVVASNGSIVPSSHNSAQLPLTARVQAVAAGKAKGYFTSTTVGSVAVRELVTGFGKGLALELVQPERNAELDSAGPRTRTCSNRRHSPRTGSRDGDCGTCATTGATTDRCSGEPRHDPRLRNTDPS